MKKCGHAILRRRFLKPSFERTNMSTTLLYQSFGTRGYQQTRIEFTQGVTRLHIQPSEKSICCSACGSKNVIRRGAKQREFRGSPIGLKRTVIVATLPRVQCHDCEVVRQIKVGFAGEGFAGVRLGFRFSIPNCIRCRRWLCDTAWSSRLGAAY